MSGRPVDAATLKSVLEGVLGPEGCRFDPAAPSAVFSRSTPDDRGSKEEAYFAYCALEMKSSRRKVVVSPLSSTVIGG